MVDVRCLSDEELQSELDKLGFSPGPILPSTRKVYEKKLMQLLVSTPCASPVMNGPRELDRAQDYDDSEELNATIILKGNIILSPEKNKGPKKWLLQALAHSRGSKHTSSHLPNSSNDKERPEASTGKPKALDISCLDCKHPEGRRYAARPSSIRLKACSNIRERALCMINRRAGNKNLETFPVGLKLAVFGIFIIVIFVYITVERKPLFG